MFYNFNPELPEPLNVIHPLQIKAVQQLINCDIPSDIKYIILFGGSLDLTCHPYSDLDLYVISENSDRMDVYERMHKICKGLKKRFDILVSSEAEFCESAREFGTVENRVLETGVCIFAKGQSDFAG